MGETDHGADPFRRHQADRLGQGYVGADMGHGDVARGQHHRVVAGTAQVGDELGVADETRRGHARRLLVHRQRDDARNVPGKGIPRRPFDVVPRRRARLRIQRTRGQVSRPEATEIHHVEFRLLGRPRVVDSVERQSHAQELRARVEDLGIPVGDDVVPELLRREPAQQDLGTHAAGVAHGDRHAHQAISGVALPPLRMTPTRPRATPAFSAIDANVTAADGSMTIFMTAASRRVQ